MKVTWISDDTRDGTIVNSYWLDQAGSVIQETDLCSGLIVKIAKIINRPTCGTPNNYINKIAEIRSIIRNHNPDLIS